MRRYGLVVLFAACGTSSLFGGPIFGNIFYQGQALRGAPITISCPGGGGRGATLDDGSYRIHVQAQGNCTLMVSSPAGAVSAPVVSTSAAAQYNFAVAPKPGGGWELRRQ